MQLNAQEWQVWEFVNGHVSLQNIAHHLRISVENVQQIAYRLIIVGLAEEYFMAAAAAPAPAPILEESLPAVPFIEPAPKPVQKPAVSQSFFKNLVGFLRNKAP